MDKLSDGLITYHMSPEEIEERYGTPGLLAKREMLGTTEADDYLIAKSAELKEKARKQRRERK